MLLPWTENPHVQLPIMGGNDVEKFQHKALLSSYYVGVAVHSIHYKCHYTLQSYLKSSYDH